MDDLIQLADLVRKRNALERQITALIGRPAQIGHIGEYIASRIFGIELKESASFKSIDGHFRDGVLKGCSVNIKWYALREGLLDLTDVPPDYYLVLTGSKSSVMRSRGRVRPWTIDGVFLFEALPLFAHLRTRGVQLGVACSVIESTWQAAEVYPKQTCTKLFLSNEQRLQLDLFRSNRDEG